jgi:DNA-binding transcriptional MocR family regulator
MVDNVAQDHWRALLPLERDRVEPLYQQLAGRLRAAIRDGAITPGEKLPPTRQMAGLLGIHRNTVVAAYRHLERRGLLSSTVGAGTFVLDRGTDARPSVVEDRPRRTVGDPFAWRTLLRNPSRFELDAHDTLSSSGLDVAGDPILLTGAVPDCRAFPMEAFRACATEVLTQADPAMLEYGPPEGDPSLRAWLGGWLAESGVPELDPARIFITSGSQQGIDLLSKLLLSARDRVAVEEPTYSGAHLTLRYAGVRRVGIPLDAEGLSTAALEEACEHDRVRLLYTMPCFQNPTGISLSAARRRELLALSRRCGLPIVEDHYDTALYYGQERPRPLLADEPSERVILLGTFSKILFPGLRLGWMVVPEPLRDVMRSLRWASDLSSGTLTQRIMDRFCRSGELDLHLQRLRGLYRERLQAMLGALDREFPDPVRWTRPEGGMTLWVDLPPGMDAGELLRESATRGVLFAPGPAFFPNGGGQAGLRLTFNRETPERIRKGVRILGELIRKRMASLDTVRKPRDGAVPLP